MRGKVNDSMRTTFVTMLSLLGLGLARPAAAQVCTPDFALDCGDADAYANDGVGSSDVVDAYGCGAGSESGSEYVYSFEAPFSFINGRREVGRVAMTCMGSPFTSAKIVRRDSCRRTISARLLPNASISRLPVKRTAADMLNAELAGSSRSSTQRRCCANEAGMTKMSSVIVLRFVSCLPVARRHQLAEMGNERPE